MPDTPDTPIIATDSSNVLQFPTANPATLETKIQNILVHTFGFEPLSPPQQSRYDAHLASLRESQVGASSPCDEDALSWLVHEGDKVLARNAVAYRDLSSSYFVASFLGYHAEFFPGGLLIQVASATTPIVERLIPFIALSLLQTPPQLSCLVTSQQLPPRMHAWLRDLTCDHFYSFPNVGTFEGWAEYYADFN